MPISENAPTRGHLLRSGIAVGAGTWMVFAALECCFLAIIPWFIHPSYAYEPVHAGFTIVVFAHYLVIGAAVGAVCGLVAPATVAVPRAVLRAAASLTVLLALMGALVLQANPSAEYWLVLAVQIGFAVALLLTIRSPQWSRRLAFAANPWTMPIALLGFPWLIWDFLYNWHARDQIAVSFAYLAGVLVVSFIAQKLFAAVRSSRRSRGADTPAFGRVAVGVFVAAALGVGCVLRQMPMVTDPPPGQKPTDVSAPHIVLMTLDTVRADHMSLHGYERDTTPKLRELAVTSTFYESAIASSDLTLSTHASIFTGLRGNGVAGHCSIVGRR